MAVSQFLKIVQLCVLLVSPSSSSLSGYVTTFHFFRPLLLCNHLVLQNESSASELKEVMKEGRTSTNRRRRRHSVCDILGIVVHTLLGVIFLCLRMEWYLWRRRSRA